MNKQTDLLIIGGGPAGIQAARTIKSRRPDLSVTMIRKERASMIYCAIPYAMEGMFDAEVVLKKDSLVTEVGVDLIRETAEELNLKDKWVRTMEGTRVEYETLFFVPGSINLVPPIPGHDLEGVLTVKTEDDMNAITSRMDAGAKCAIAVGAGAIGLEQAMAFRHRGLKTHLVDLSDRILPNMSDPEMSGDAHKILEDQGITIHLNSGLQSLNGTDGRVTSVTLDSGEVIPLANEHDFVVLAVGMRPLTHLVEGQLDIGPGGIIVNNRMETSVPGVYSAGDVTQSWSGIDENLLDGKLATNAVPMAKVAAANIMGGDAEYPGIFNGSVTVVGDLRIGGTGFTETFAKSRGFETVVGYGETTSRFPMMPGATQLKVKLIADRHTGRIIGGQVVGKEAVAERIDVITLAIQTRMTAAQLAQLSYSAQPWQTFFPARNAIVQAASNIASKLTNTVKPVNQVALKC